MLYGFLSVLAIIGCLYGWGSIFFARRRPENPWTPAFFGLTLTCIAALIGHFVAPLSSTVSWIWLSTGCMLGLWGFYQARLKFHLGYFLISWTTLILATGYALDNNLMGDSLLYHIQAMIWNKGDKIVLGLANLQDRFGFNSLWLLATSLLTPQISSQTYVDWVSVAFLLICLGYFYYEYRAHLTTSKLAGILLFVIVVPWGKSAFFMPLGSPTTDLPAGLLVIMSLFLTWHCLLEQKISRERYTLLALTCTLAVMTKFSTLYLLVPALIGMYYAYKSQVNPKYIACITLGALAFIALWSFRGYLLSGCWIFPEEKSCFPLASWTVPPELVLDQKLWIKSWARQPSIDHSIVLAQGYDWMSGWWQRLWSERYTQYSLVVLVLALIRFAVRDLKSAPYRRVYKRFVFFFVYLAACFVFWFAMAPDVRFATGLFSFSLALVLGYFVHSPMHKFERTFILLLIISFVTDYGRIMINATLKYPLEKKWEHNEQSILDSKTTSQHGVVYFQPADGYCHLVNTPCAPIPRPYLKAGHVGAYKAFFHTENKDSE